MSGHKDLFTRTPGGGGGGGGGSIPVVTDLAAESISDGKLVYWEVSAVPGPAFFKMRAVQATLMGYDLKLWSYDGATILGQDGYERSWSSEAVFSGGGGLTMDIPAPGIYGSEWRFEYGFTGTGEARINSDENMFYTPGVPTTLSPPAVGDGGSCMNKGFANLPPYGSPTVSLDLQSGGTYDWIWLKIKPVSFIMEVVS